MATVYAVYDSDGCVGRCDAKCHNATQPECHCICGGAMHGVGGKIAMEDRAYLTDDEILETCKKLGATGSLRVVRTTEQIEMFAEFTGIPKQSKNSLDAGRAGG